MDSVLECFQRLMANLRLGPSSTVQARDFSNALKLDHYEQQDPNEFSRLLLDLMHESFQRTATGGCSGQRSLARLLPDIFQGKMVFETTCLTCQRVSRRVESFMDINLPIVRPTDQLQDDDTSSRDTTKRPVNTLLSWISGLSQSKSKPSSAADNHTDVQYCLNEYFRDELLDGDNKYYCESCTAKREARRQPVLRELPKVLNVQLSRYVYDRDKNMKKKLSDKVLLPLNLTLYASPPGDDDNDLTRAECRGPSSSASPEPRPHRYLLCAVMRHHGQSAYSGHYVAEAMDWLTGTWFEFNDEKVAVLTQPSCSYDPANIAEILAHDLEPGLSGTAGRRKKSKVLSGSSDAYNMYYVDEAFLASSVLESLRTNPLTAAGAVDELDSKPAPQQPHQVPGVVQEVDLSRTNEYKNVAVYVYLTCLNRFAQLREFSPLCVSLLGLKNVRKGLYGRRSTAGATTNDSA